MADSIFTAASGKKLIEAAANTVHFGSIVYPSSDAACDVKLQDNALKDKNGRPVLDEVLVSVFKAPHSFTGEDSVEICCHGSRYIQSEILKLLINNGGRMAAPGEYTKRAFLNGKMDLSQAEAVADVISATSQASLKIAMRQMRGGFTKELEGMRAKLLELTSLLELELDFSEEDVEFADREQLKSLCRDVDDKVRKLCKSFSLGNAIKNGVPVAIVGPANAGKSTLLNAFLNEDRAIVSEIAGTTRDVIEDTAVIDGITFRFIDTAGIRATKNHIERLGIERTFDKISKAQIVLLLFPDHIFDDDEYMDSGDGGSIGSCSEDLRIEYTRQIKEHMAEGAKLITVFTKIDKTPGYYEFKKLYGTGIFENEKDGAQSGVGEDEHFMRISALTGDGMQELTETLVKSVQVESDPETDVIISNMRHYEALKAAHEALQRVFEGLDSQLPGDLVSQDLRECLYHLGSITGQISTEEVLGSIFSRFCVGK